MHRESLDAVTRKRSRLLKKCGTGLQPVRYLVFQRLEQLTVSFSELVLPSPLY